MSTDFLVKLFEHNNWANRQILEICSRLSEQQIDAQPRSAAKGSIRETLVHLVTSQRGYLSLLTLPVGDRPRGPVAFADLQASLNSSGDGLLLLLGGRNESTPQARLRTTDDFYVEPWVIVVQIINHATEHREQIKSMLTALGITPPDLDGWGYGEVTNALAPVSAG